ncbi:unnamed protein product [Cylindrotheca closterium]|uniref:PDZ domain-containing protein n=1 Tax=Cylindrotheca closterium TaxID=2856 RepID=A0AAD2CGW9_9STRA|nr:unnamed protein product [Cylindrotheca closterium]
MPALMCPMKLRIRRRSGNNNNNKTTTKKKNESSSSKHDDEDDDVKECERHSSFRPNQHSSITLAQDDVVIIATKKSKKQLIGLILERKQQEEDPNNCPIVVRKIMEGSLFAKTNLIPDMEIRVINGIDCSKLKAIAEAYSIMTEAERTVTIVARGETKKAVEENKDQLLTPIVRPPTRRSAPAHMWLEMVDNMNHKDIRLFASQEPNDEELLLLSPRREEAKDEDILEAPPRPSFKTTSRPRRLPSNLEMDNKISSHSTMSEITLNPSQHPAPTPDIVITRPIGSKNKSSVKSVLAALYPDYGDSDDNQNGSSIESSSSSCHSTTKDISFASTSLVSKESPPRRLQRGAVGDLVPLPPPLLNDNSAGPLFRGAGPMESHSLYAPSIPRVGARDAI